MCTQVCARCMSSEVVLHGEVVGFGDGDGGGDCGVIVYAHALRTRTLRQWPLSA